jgi:hypothetical protein
MHLGIALSRSASRLQSQITPTSRLFGETMRIFQRQQEGQRDQRARALDLLQQLHLRITRFGQGFDPLVVLADPLFTGGESRCDLRKRFLKYYYKR